LGNIGMLPGRQLRWDPIREGFMGGEPAGVSVARPQRPPYSIEA
jgi:hypothetical protein